jgi:hypothetical protein
MYFKSTYETGLVYSEGWYGTLDYAPEGVEILLYNDNDGYCICRKDEYDSALLSQDTVTELTEEQALQIVGEINGG